MDRLGQILEALSALYGLSAEDMEYIRSYCTSRPEERQEMRAHKGRASMDDAAYSKT